MEINYSPSLMCADLLNLRTEVENLAKAGCRETLLKIKSINKRAGIAINPNSSLTYLEETMGLVEAIIVMAVNPGYAGQKFIESTYEQLRKVIAICKNVECNPELLIDGSIGVNNIKQLVALGATGFVLGSAGLFRDGNDYVANLNQLKESLD